jgi:hypothetical protein
MSMLDDVRFWAQVTTDQERTVVCPPEYESRLKSMIAARGLSGLLTVLPSPVCPDNTVIVMDQHAMDANMAQVMQAYRGAFWRR